MGSLFGTRIRIHWMFCIFALFSLVGAGDKQAAVLYMVVLFTTVLIHEFGHIFAARHFGLRAERIVLWPLGGLAFVGESRRASEEFWISFFGPFTQLVIGAVVGLVLYLQGATFMFVPSLLSPLAVVGGPQGTLGLILTVIFSVQVWLFAFNVLLPAWPLDGGRMLVALVINRVGSLKASGMAMVLTLICSAYLLASGSQLLGIFLMMDAAMLYQLRQTGQIFQHPSFNFGTQPIYTSAPRKASKAAKSKQVPHLRLVESKQCPQCGRSLPLSAKMCGFCEISV